MYENENVVANRIPSLAERMADIKNNSVNILSSLRSPIYVGRDFAKTFYSVIQDELSPFEQNVLFELMNFGSGENGTIKGNYCIYEHYLQTRGVEGFYSSLVKAIATDRKIYTHFMSKSHRSYKKIDVTKMAIVKPISFTEESVKSTVMAYLGEIRSNITSSTINQRAGLPTETVVDMEIKQTLLELLYKFEHEVRGGESFKLWYIEKKLGTEEGLTVDFETLGTQALLQLVISFTTSNIVGFLAFLNYSSFDLIYGKMSKGLKPIRFIMI